MISKFLSILLLGFVSLFSTVGVLQASILPPSPTIQGTSYLLVDFDTGEILLEKNINKPRDPASITKVMTAYAVLQELKHNPNLLNETVIISENAYKIGGSRTFLELNSRVPLKTVLLGLMVQSGNDASVALAEFMDGTEAAFVDRMNSYAERLGMQTTQFMNSTGWPDPDHYSSAEDMAKLAIAFIKEFPEQYQWFAQKEMTYNRIKQRNRNRLLWRDPTVDGIKTGHTEKAGYCLLASAKRGNQRLISVLFGAKSDKERTIQSQRLLNYGFRYYKNVVVEKASNSVLNKRVWFGQSQQIDIGFQQDWMVSVPKRIANQLQAQYQLDSEDLKAPIQQGQRLGTAKLMYKNQVLDERPIYALADVPESGLLSQLWDYVMYFFNSLLSLFSLKL